MEKRTLTDPPADPELGIARDPLNYFIVRPENGMTPNTGLIFWVVGWGMDPDGEYSIEKLMPYLANKYDCLVVSIKYQGSVIKSKNASFSLGVSSAWMHAIQQKYGVAPENDLPLMFAKLKAAGVNGLGGELPVFQDFGNHYLSFGFMPVLDHIAVLAAVLKEFPVNRKRIMALGSSYGGYIVSLLLKFLPNTLSVAIDNSGFAKVVWAELNYQETNMRQKLVSPDGFEFRIIVLSPWKLRDERSPHFFRPAYAMVRDLTLIDHMQPSETKLFAFHTPADKIAPLAEKEMFCKTRSQFAPTELQVVTSGDIDGHVFKTLDHGMQASMRGLFDLVADRVQDLSRVSDLTDFERETRFDLICKDRIYRLAFHKNLTFTCALEVVARLP